MAKTRLFISCYIGFLACMILKSLFGSGGLVDYSAVVQYQHRLKQNLQELEAIYLDLYADLESLKSSAEIVKLYGRELGYFEKDEHVIRFDGLDARKSFYKVGTLLNKTREQDGADQIIFICLGLGIALVVYLFSFLVSAKKEQRYGYRKR